MVPSGFRTHCCRTSAQGRSGNDKLRLRVGAALVPSASLADRRLPQMPLQRAEKAVARDKRATTQDLQL